MLRINILLSLLSLIVFFAKGESYNRWRFGVRAEGGVTTIDYPGSAKNADFVFASGVSVPVGFSVTDWMEVKSGIDFRKTGYRDSAQVMENQESGSYTFSTYSYRLGIPLEFAFYPIPAKSCYLFLGIDNGLVVKSSYNESMSDGLPLPGHGIMSIFCVA